MSTADSQLLAAASAFSSDVYKPLVRKNKASDREMLWTGRLVVIAIAVIALLIASLDKESTIMSLVSNAWGIFGAAFGPAIMLSLFWKRFNFAGALAAIITGAVVDILWGNNASDTYGSDGTRLRWGYVVRLMPLYHGTATGVGLGLLHMSNRDPVTDVSRSWEQEYIMGAVTDEGVRRLTWGCPLKVTEVVAEHARLLPFSEIEEIAQQQINRKLAYSHQENGSLEVAGVILGLVYMGEQNNAEGGLLAPVWVFLKADRPNDQQQKLWAQLGQTPATPYYDTLNPLVMINAVDGTIIDPYAGY
jgi:hypothetical protein